MRRKFGIRQILSLFFLLVLLVGVFVATGLAQKVQQLFTQASGTPANIIVDSSKEIAPLYPLWQALAQGGEEPGPMIRSVLNETKALRPKYIRIDHIYDAYDVVSKNGDQLSFNFSRLDEMVNDILQTGALPFISISYMPPAIAQGDIVSPPKNWADWEAVVKATVEHFSGRGNRNINGVIYEVWNEPDLFGGWKIGGQKDYRVLYSHSVTGALRATNVNPFKIGGPATTAPYANWVSVFLKYCAANRIRIDFYSWHRYALSPQVFTKDADSVDSWLFQNLGSTLDKYITEWGSDPANNPFHDQQYDAAHTIASVGKMLGRIDLAFTFEIKDGPSPEGKKYWGRWGILTHEKFGIDKKPRYHALNLLNKMTGMQIDLRGEGTWVTGFASRDNQTVKIILTNLDQFGKHFETVPVTVANLPDGNFSVKTTYLLKSQMTTQATATGGILKIQIPLSPNDGAVVEINKI